MLIKAASERSLTFRRALGRFADIYKPSLEVKRIDATRLWSDALGQRQGRAFLQLFDRLRTDAPIKVELEPMRINFRVAHTAGIDRILA